MFKFVYEDRLYASPYRGEIGDSIILIDEKVAEVYRILQNKEEVAYFENNNGLVEYFDNQEDFLMRITELSDKNSSNLRSIQTTHGIHRLGSKIWYIETTVYPTNSNRIYYRVTGNNEAVSLQMIGLTHMYGGCGSAVITGGTKHILTYVLNMDTGSVKSAGYDNTLVSLSTHDYEYVSSSGRYYKKTDYTFNGYSFYVTSVNNYKINGYYCPSSEPEISFWVELNRTGPSPSPGRGGVGGRN